MQGDVPQSPIDESIGALVAEAARRWGPAPFLDVAGELLSYEDLEARAQVDAAALASLGIQHGDRFATLVDNSVDAVTLWLGAAMLGAIEVTVNSAYRGEFLAHQLADSAVRLLIVEASYAHRLSGDVLERLPNLETVVVRGDLPNDVDAPARPMIPLDSLRRTAPRVPMPEVIGSDIAAIIYTAGTTGPSKGCVLSHAYMLHSARRVSYTLGRTQEMVIYTPTPLFHMNARSVAVLGTLLYGGRAVLDRRFSVTGFWPEINRTQATMASLVGAMLPLIAGAPATPAEEACTSLEAVAGAPFPPHLVEQFQSRFGVRCIAAPVYGLTEAAPITVQSPDEPAPPGSSGRVDEAHWDVRIFDEHDRPVPAATPGEIVCRPMTPGVMFDGYWGRPADTLDRFRNLWFHTGDVGRFDEDGYFYFVDRKKDYLRRRGENISSFEMEAAFARHPDLLEVAVHAVPSQLTEDDVKVTAVLQPGTQLSEKELHDWCLDQVPAFAVPRYIEFRAELPKNPLNRVLKYELREEGVTPATWDRDA